MNKICIVIPTIRKEYIKEFLTKWEKHFSGCPVIVVEDNPVKTFQLPDRVSHYSWEDIDKELGKNSWIIPRRSAAIRSYGFLKAWQMKAEYILTLDDDCLPEDDFKGNFIYEVIKNLNKEWDNDKWWNTLRDSKVFPRGFPYNIRQLKQPTMIHHGLWSHIPDLDGITQKTNPTFQTKPFHKVEKIPRGQYYPMSSMNLAFRREVAPLFYMLLMGKDNKGNDWGYERFDDIWAGLFTKKICDYLGYAISSGYPSIHHDRASNVDANIKKEKEGIKTNEWLWKKVANMTMVSTDVMGCYLEISEQIRGYSDYFSKLSRAMKIWVLLLKNSK